MALTFVRDSNPKGTAGLAVVRVGDLYHVVFYSERNGQVTSALASDSPPKSSGCSAYFANSLTDTAVKTVSKGRSRAAAMAGYRRLMDGW
jgi:hypothetical protein